MKSNRLLTLFAVILLAAGCQTVTPVPNDGRVTVIFDQPEKFTDAKSSFQGFTDQGYLDDLKRYIDRTARGYLAEGQRLTVKFTDIDMAGDFIPGRPQLNDVRVMKAIYPPRLKFSYTVTDAAGQTVKQGDENLTDLTYQSRLRTTSTDEPLFYEKALLADWMSDKLRK
jgi:hypothetical protein